MEIIPAAVGQSDGVIVFWDNNPEISVAWPRPLQVIEETQWGISSLDNADCLVLYMFAQGGSIELYLKEQLPTTPTNELDVWALLCDWNPNVLKIRYADTPVDGQHEITFLLPQGDGQSLVDRLEAFRELTLATDEGNGTVVERHRTLFGRLDAFLNSSTQQG